jgi:hypothetical protein
MLCLSLVSILVTSVYFDSYVLRSKICLNLPKSMFRKWVYNKVYSLLMRQSWIQNLALKFASIVNSDSLLCICKLDWQNKTQNVLGQFNELRT